MMIDALFAQNNKPKAELKKDEKAAVNQNDIDALFAKNNKPKAELKKDEKAAVDQNDIDAMFKNHDKKIRESQDLDGSWIRS